MIINCNDNVYNPLGGGSYVFEKDIANFLLKKFNKDKILISIGAQPNSSPHFGTLIVFSTAFSLARKMKEINPNLDVKVLFEVVDTAPSETVEIDGIKYQKSLKITGRINNNFNDYLEILEYFKNCDDIDYQIRFQSEFNKQEYIYPIVRKIIDKKDELASILDPKYNNLRIRVACPECGLADKNSMLTKFDGDEIHSFCPVHGEYVTNIKENSDRLEYNTPVRNLVRGIAYGMYNEDEKQDNQIMRITGSDYAGFYQEELLYKPASIIGYDVNKLPAILYTPLVLDWSGAKLSKSLYVKEGAYSDLPPYLINYEFLKNEKGIEALDVIHDITNNWIENPYLLFRNYSIYYFKKEFEEREKSNIHKYKTRVYKKD